MDALKECIVLGRKDGLLGLCQRLRSVADRAEEGFQIDQETEHLQLAVASSLLADLCEQDWDVDVRDGDIMVSAPDWNHVTGREVERTKARIRSSLQLASDRQLASDSVQDFLRGMQRERVHNGKIVSVSSLVDDGSELASRLRKVVPFDEEQRRKELGRLFKPYVQACEDATNCEFTGYSLLDIWRYFRHTWSLEYNPVPGRTLRLLVRNAGRPGHPVVGIAMLASPAANLYIRDEWIGWRIEDIVEGLLTDTLDAESVARTIWRTIADAISDIRYDDLLAPSESGFPTEETFFKLQQIAGMAHHRRRQDLIAVMEGAEFNDDKIIDIRTFDRRSSATRDWKKLSETPLFVKKRAEQLIPLLRARAFLQNLDMERCPAAALYEALVTKPGKVVISFVLGEIRKRKIATEIADLAVCGAIAPYNHLLGGKLVTLLMASDDVRKIYSERYGSQVSEIASQMAGRPIVRPADLRVVTTTSLYGVSSSQYNRIKVAVRERSAERMLEWAYLGNSKGISITHVSSRTVALMKALGRKVHGVGRINSVFGEGSSPRTRQIREGLNLIGINNNSVLEQSVGRRVYACELYPGARSVLTGFTSTKVREKGVSAASINRAWIERWLTNRVLNQTVLERVSQSKPLSIHQMLRERALAGKSEAECSGLQDLIGITNSA